LIHNFAWSYAVSGYSYGIYEGSVPRYAEDLTNMEAYATPARAFGPVARTRFTQNAINSKTLRTDDAPKGSNSPGLGWRLVLDPVWRSRAEQETTGFQFYAFAKESFTPPAVVRLGKKGCPVRLEWSEVDNPVGQICETPVYPTHAVNPLDISGDVVSYDPVAIPPHMIFRSAEISKDWFVFAGDHRIHIPRRILER
jgi:CRISPR type I-D-associated protein Csc1